MERHPRWDRCAKPRPNPGPASEFDVVIHGGTSAGVVAAVQARVMGRSVVLVCPGRHVGGLSAIGLGWTDSGDKRVIGGLARAFYRRVKAHYDRLEADAMWVFEPRVAEAVFEDLLREHGIPVRREARLDRWHGVALEGTRITSITTLDAEAGNRAVAGDCSPSEPSGPPLPLPREDRSPDGPRPSFFGPCGR